MWGILVGGALALRAAFSGARLALTGDELHYAEILHRFLHGRFLDGISGYWSYAYPMLAWPFGRLLGDAEAGLRLLSILAGAATVVPVSLVARRLWGDRAALFAGLLTALHPLLIEFSTGAFTESVFSLLLASALLAAIGLFRGGGVLRAAAAGGLLGLAWLVRPEAVAVLAIILPVFLAGASVPRARRVVLAGIVAGVFLVPVLGHGVLMHRATGRWTTGSKAAVNLSSPVIWEEGLERERFVYTLDETGTRRRIETLGERGLAEVLRERGGTIAEHWLRNLLRSPAAIPALLVSPLLFLLVPLGVAGRRWPAGRRAEETLLVFVGLCPFLLYSLFRVQVRYLEPFLPVYLLWGGAGCVVAADWLRRALPGRGWIATAALFAVFASLVPFGATKYRATRAGQRPEYREIGAWIQENVEGAVVMAPPGCPVSYYAGDPVASFVPWTDPAGLVSFARARGFTHLVADEAWLRERRPTLAPLLAGGPVAGIRPLHRFETPRGAVLLYRFDDRP